MRPSFCDLYFCDQSSRGKPRPQKTKLPFPGPWASCSRWTQYRRGAVLRQALDTAAGGSVQPEDVEAALTYGYLFMYLACGALWRPEGTAHHGQGRALAATGCGRSTAGPIRVGPRLWRRWGLRRWPGAWRPTRRSKGPMAHHSRGRALASTACGRSTAGHVRVGLWLRRRWWLRRWPGACRGPQ